MTGIEAYEGKIWCQESSTRHLFAQLCIRPQLPDTCTAGVVPNTILPSTHLDGFT